jgi:hypothetical protein
MKSDRSLGFLAARPRAKRPRATTEGRGAAVDHTDPEGDGIKLTGPMPGQ